jgi:hypothetical protein
MTRQVDASIHAVAPLSSVIISIHLFGSDTIEFVTSLLYLLPGITIIGPIQTVLSGSKPLRMVRSCLPPYLNLSNSLKKKFTNYSDCIENFIDESELFENLIVRNAEEINIFKKTETKKD